MDWITWKHWITWIQHTEDPFSVLSLSVYLQRLNLEMFEQAREVRPGVAIIYDSAPARVIPDRSRTLRGRSARSKLALGLGGPQGDKTRSVENGARGRLVSRVLK